MQTYLNEIEHAATISLTAVWQEYSEAEVLAERVSNQTKLMHEGYRRAVAWQESEDPDDVMLGAGIHWDTYFGPDKERHHAQESLDNTKEKLTKLNFSIESLSGNILQHAKQGISIVHGEPANCPVGRIIGTQSIEKIIWQARNQSLHWESQIFHPPVVNCFNKLSKEINSEFSLYTSRNMAFDIINLFNWRTFRDFKIDMLSIA